MWDLHLFTFCHMRRFRISRGRVIERTIGRYRVWWRIALLSIGLQAGIRSVQRECIPEMYYFTSVETSSFRSVGFSHTIYAVDMSLCTYVYS